MAKVTIEFDTDNAAFEGTNEGGETAAILKRIAVQAESRTLIGSMDGMPVRDTYGNTVGSITVKEA